MDRSTIEWTDATWNPLDGCSPVSEGCRYCYAARMAMRLSGPGLMYEGLAEMRGGRPVFTGKLVVREHRLDMPRGWKTPRRVFVNSMSDLFHDDVPVAYIQKVFSVMADCPQHTFQILTKRSERLMELAATLPWPDHIWMGVSVENEAAVHRIADLVRTRAKTKFLSVEPLIGPIDALPLDGIDWVIVGGESGPRARPMDPDWARSIRDQCLAKSVPFFFKQWGGTNKKQAGRVLDNRTWDDMPGRHGQQSITAAVVADAHRGN